MKELWFSKKIKTKKEHPLYAAVLEELKAVGFEFKEKHPEFKVMLANLIKQIRKEGLNITRVQCHQSNYNKKDGELKLEKARFDCLRDALIKAELIDWKNGFSNEKTGIGKCSYFKVTQKMKDLYQKHRITYVPPVESIEGYSIQKLEDPEVIPHKRGYLKLQMTTKKKKGKPKLKEYIKYDGRSAKVESFKKSLNRINNRYTSDNIKVYIDSIIFNDKFKTIIASYNEELDNIIHDLESNNEMLSPGKAKIKQLVKQKERLLNKLSGIENSISTATNFDLIIEEKKRYKEDRREEEALCTVYEEILIKCRNTPDFYEITVDKLTLNRVFSKVGKDPDWVNGGRFYSNIQALPSKLRSCLHINLEPTIEIDYSAMHPSILYHKIGLEPNQPYIIDDIPRDLVKIAFNVMLNCKSKAASIGALAEKVKSVDPEEAIDLPKNLSLKELVKKIEAKHEPIKDCFYSSAWGRLQNIDGNIAEKILLDKDLHAVGIHDSFLVPMSEANLLAARMTEHYQKIVGTTFEPVLKVEGQYIENRKGTLSTLGDLNKQTEVMESVSP